MSNAKAAREPSCRVIPDHFPDVGKMIWFSFKGQHEGLLRQKKTPQNPDKLENGKASDE